MIENRKMISKFSKIKEDILDFIFPKKCFSCDNDILKDFHFCNSCENFLEEIRYNICQKCGYPLDIESIQCGMCSRLDFSFDMARSYCIYNDAIKKMILDIKYNDNFSPVPFFVDAIFSMVEFYGIEFDLIAAVPMTEKRFRKRMYNQSAIFGLYLKEKFPDKKFIPDLLIKTRESTVQTGSKAQDRINKKHYIELNEKFKEEVQKKKILILDDVMTTGATLHACAEAIKKGNLESQVYCLTFARSVLF